MCAMFRNASHFPSEGSLGGLISGLSGALRQVGDAAASVLGGRGVRMDEDGQDRSRRRCRPRPGPATTRMR